MDTLNTHDKQMYDSWTTAQKQMYHELKAMCEKMTRSGTDPTTMTQELVIFASAFIGATIGFLWYNSYPAQVFMGDTGSLALGGIIAVFAIIIRKELLIPILCGIFLVEALSVMIQVTWFKRTKRKYGEGRRVFLMAPLHHHYQKKGYPEPKIVTRFWIVAIILAVISIVTLKIR